MTLSPSSTKFSSYCDLLTKLKKCTKAVDRKYEFEKFFKQRDACFTFLSDDFLPFLRILLPTLDSDRRFDIKHKKLTHRVGKLLSVQPAKIASMDALSGSDAVEKLAEEVSSRVVSKGEGLTVSEVNERLDKMAVKEGRDPEDADFEFLFQRCSTQELLWIFNVMIRNVESYIGASASSLLGMLDDEARERWTLSRHLSAVTDVGPSDSILGKNFRPMLLSRLPRLTDWWQPISVHAGSDFFVELKYDGEHVLLHKINKDTYRYFTRNGMDFSIDYGMSGIEGSVSSRIHSFFLDSCVDCILDVELVLWDKKTNAVCRHGRDASDGHTYAFRYVREDSAVFISVVLFDVLYYNGRSLLNVPLEERLKVLDKGILKKEAVDTIHIAKRYNMSTRAEVDEFFSTAMQKDEEGIVIKNRHSLYIPGSRALSNGWFKLKPNLASSCSLDLACVAVLYGEGADGKNLYLLAARDERTGKLVVVGSASVGLTEVDRKRLLRDATRDGELTAVPHDSISGRPIERKGGYIHPHSINVVEVTCTGVRAGKLVDPVLKCIREKPLDEVDSTKEFNELAEVLRQCHLPEEKDTVEAKKKRGNEPPQVIPSKAKKMKKEESEREDEEEEEGGMREALKGRTVCVLQGLDEKIRRAAFEALQAFGATTVANPVKGTDVVLVVSRNHPKTRMMEKKGEWRMIDAAWIIRCHSQGQLAPWSEEDIVFDVEGGFHVE